MCDESSAKMKAFLEQKKLAHLWQEIQNNGYDNFDFLCDMDEEDVRTMLLDIGVTKIGHIRLFLKAWKSLNIENSIKMSLPVSSTKTTATVTSSASGSKNSPIEELECIVKLSEQESIENSYLEKSILGLPSNPIMVNPSVHESIVYPSLQKRVINPSSKASSVISASIESIPAPPVENAQIPSPPVENTDIPAPPVESKIVPPTEKGKIDPLVEKRKSPVESHMDVVILDSPVSSSTMLSPTASQNADLTDAESSSDSSPVELSRKESNSKEHTVNPTGEPSTSQSKSTKVDFDVDNDPEIINLQNSPVHSGRDASSKKDFPDDSNLVKYPKKSIKSESCRTAVGEDSIIRKRNFHLSTKCKSCNTIKSEDDEIREVHKSERDEKVKRHKVERVEKLKKHDRDRSRLLKKHESECDELLRMHEGEDVLD